MKISATSDILRIVHDGKRYTLDMNRPGRSLFVADDGRELTQKQMASKLCKQFSFVSGLIAGVRATRSEWNRQRNVIAKIRDHVEETINGKSMRRMLEPCEYQGYARMARKIRRMLSRTTRVDNPDVTA